MHSQKISVIGLGRIGYPAAACLAQAGYRVYGVDTNRDWLARLQRLEADEFEPSLKAIADEGIRSERFTLTSEVPAADVFLIAVQTPLSETGLNADLTALFAAVDTVAPNLQAGNLLLLESTCPPGTTEEVARRLADRRPDLAFAGQKSEFNKVFVAYCPERVLPGRIVHELNSVPRIAGGLCPESATRAAEFYRKAFGVNCSTTTARLAEMVKLTENSFRDVNLAFSNEISMICDDWNLDVGELIQLVNQHPRVKMLQPGPGVGGHCVAIDPWFLVAAAPERSTLIRKAREVNNSKREFVADKILSTARRLEAKTIACLGLAFKAGVSDLRESPAVSITRFLALNQPQTRVLVIEPHVHLLPPELVCLPNVELADTAALNQADLICVLVAHSQFQTLPYPQGTPVLNFVNS